MRGENPRRHSVSAVAAQIAEGRVESNQSPQSSNRSPLPRHCGSAENQIGLSETAPLLAPDASEDSATETKFPLDTPPRPRICGAERAIREMVFFLGTGWWGK